MIKSMTIGETRGYERIITDEDVRRFAELTGDFNQAHFDADYCKKTMFKKPIVHGMLIGSLFSKIFGCEYPGEGTIYCGQSLKFLRPVYPNTTLSIKVTVKEIIYEKNRVIFTTEVYDDQGQLCLTGEALMMPRKEENHE